LRFESAVLGMMSNSDTRLLRTFYVVESIRGWTPNNCVKRFYCFICFSRSWRVREKSFHKSDHR